LAAFAAGFDSFCGFDFTTADLFLGALCATARLLDDATDLTADFALFTMFTLALEGLLDLDDFNAFFGLAMGEIPLKNNAKNEVKKPRSKARRHLTKGNRLLYLKTDRESLRSSLRNLLL
jgi:hypothetical protein